MPRQGSDSAEGPGKKAGHWLSSSISPCWCQHLAFHVFSPCSVPAISPWDCWACVACTWLPLHGMKVMWTWQVNYQPQPRVSVRVRVKVDDLRGHEKERGQRRAGWRPNFNTGKRETGLLYTAVQTAQNTQGGDEWGWNGTHIPLTKLCLGQELCCLEKNLHLPRPGRNGSVELETARRTQQHIKDTTVKPRQAWAPQVLDTTDMWVDKGWWLGSALQWQAVTTGAIGWQAETPHSSVILLCLHFSFISLRVIHPPTSWKHHSTPEF